MVSDESRLVVGLLILGVDPERDRCVYIVIFALSSAQVETDC